MKPLFAMLMCCGCASVASAQQIVAGDRLNITSTASLSGSVGHPDYVSQLTRWRIDSLGAADFRYLFSDELHVRTFVADLEQALAGSQIIAKSVAVLASNYTVPAGGAASTMTVKDLPSAENMAVFESGDTVRLRSFSRASGSLTVADAYGVVTAYADQVGGVQTWTFTRTGGSDGGTLSAGSVIQADALVLDYGVNGNGYHEINAIDGIYGINSPYSQVVTWQNSPVPANLTVRSRIGNLRGITGVTNEYGAILGTYAATDGQYVRVSNQAVEIHGVNLQMWDGATNVIKLDRAVPSFAIGSPVPSAYGTGTGIWMGKDAGVYKFRVGNPVGNRVTWDGSTLAVVGTITASAGTIGGWTIGSTTLTGGDATLSSSGNLTLGTGNNIVRLSADSATHRIWVGNATASSAPFRVTPAGALTATNATLTGSLSAGGGTVVIDSNGISISAGTGTANRIKWGTSGNVTAASNTLFLFGATNISLQAVSSSTGMLVGSSEVNPIGSSMSLGGASDPWDEIQVRDNIYFQSPPDSTSADYPIVRSDGNGSLWRKTNGSNGTLCSGSAGVATIVVERGIVVGATCF